jgi:hypothetical protein
MPHSYSVFSLLILRNSCIAPVNIGSFWERRRAQSNANMTLEIPPFCYASTLELAFNTGILDTQLKYWFSPSPKNSKEAGTRDRGSESARAYK